jgi:hypothetical protein
LIKYFENKLGLTAKATFFVSCNRQAKVWRKLYALYLIQFQLDFAISLFNKNSQGFTSSETLTIKTNLF